MNWWSGVIKKVNKSPTNMAICTFKVQSAFKTTHDTFSVCSVWIKFSMRAIPSARCFFARGLFFHWCVPCSFGTLMTQIGLFVRNSVRECRVNAYKQRAKAATRKRIIIFILWYAGHAWFLSTFQALHCLSNIMWHELVVLCCSGWLTLYLIRS